MIGLGYLPGGSHSSWAKGVSADGTVIARRGYNPNGEREAWVTTISEPCTVALLGLGGMIVLRRRRV